jgi:menaquinone-dependent protoporphyrinogen oxidase
MAEQRVLVAFANQAGSTAGIASAVAAELRRAGLAVDCRLVTDVQDLAPYRAVILGSGVFVPRRRSDGGGFITRHRAELAARRVWLFSAGPIGRGRCQDGGPAPDDECSVVAVGRAVGARGTAVLGPIGLSADADPMEALSPVNHERVRAWAREIAADLRLPGPAAPTRRGPLIRCRPVAAGR